MGRYGSWHDQVDAGTKADMHDNWIHSMECANAEACIIGKCPTPTLCNDFGGCDARLLQSKKTAA